MGEIKLFEKEEFGKVRVVMVGNDPWFYGTDVAKALGYENPARDVQRHCKKVNKFSPTESVGTPYNIIPESDVYRLVMRSNLPNAEKFQDWVVEEVLPSIRKTGQYGGIPDFTDPVAAARAWADEYEAKQRSALILLKRMSKPPFLDRFGGFALSRGCPDPELIAVSAGSFNEANVLEPHRR